MPKTRTLALSALTVITVISTATFSANAQQKMCPPAPLAPQTQSQKNWLRKLVKNPGAKHKGGIVTTVNGREVIAYPRATPAPIR